MSSGLENWLDDAACRRFLKLIGARKRPPSLPYLAELLRACFARVPFNNLSMLTGPRRPPTQDEIIEMMLRGLGGPCDVHNFFLCALLHRLGFNAGLLPASMHEPDCHIGIIIDFENRAPQKYWVDFGNGFPYLTPLPIIDGASAAPLGFEYALEVRGARATLWQSRSSARGRVANQTIALRPVHYSHFDSMRARHYGEVGFGPFLSGVRLYRWEANRGFVLRDKIIRDIPGRRRVAGFQTRLRWVKQNFDGGADGGLFAPLYRKCVELINATDK
ncbi:MAG: hypothetical protein GKR94_20340 [Gammaproteobacteria bacterium]|nr:hypothetical protein [Gammaproteobacteria bacterium]